MTLAAEYIIESDKERDPHAFVPEESRRGRAVPIYAALRTKGRRGFGDLVDPCSTLATRLADRLRADPRLEVLNDVVLNQVLIRVRGTDADAATRAMVDRLEKNGTCWASGTTWHGVSALRLSVCTIPRGKRTSTGRPTRLRGAPEPWVPEAGRRLPGAGHPAAAEARRSAGIRAIRTT
jgi:hypothetical protein